jgi:hypothetical protein
MQIEPGMKVETETRRVYVGNPGVVKGVFEDRLDKWWAVVEHTTTTNIPIQELHVWCDWCRNQGGKWVCAGKGYDNKRMCPWHLCDEDHTFLECHNDHSSPEPPKES